MGRRADIANDERNLDGDGEAHRFGFESHARADVVVMARAPRKQRHRTGDGGDFRLRPET